MKIKPNKGFALAIAIYFMIFCLITSIWLYSISYYITNEVRVQEASSVRGYYTSMAALRYAYILLKDPVTNFGFLTPAHNGEPKTITVLKTSPLGIDLRLGGNDALSITAVEGKSGVTDHDFPNRKDGEYKVTASFIS